MEILVKTQEGKFLPLLVYNSDTIGSVKQKIQVKSGIHYVH